jgi:molybdate transport system substrate-binding protein
VQRTPILLFLAISLFFLTLFPICPATAQERLRVAVAANFMAPIQEIARQFSTSTGIAVEPTFSSTGQLFAQIVNGAPYDGFLAADEERPALLHQKGLADTPFVYARGEVVLWTARRELCGKPGWREVLQSPEVRKIAIANPKIAPYGAAAMAALEKAGLVQVVQDRLVFAQTIAQAFQYTVSGAADIGLCARSSTLTESGRGGCTYTIAEAPPVVQGACLILKTSKRDATERFLRFLASPEALSVKQKYGYR